MLSRHIAGLLAVALLLVGCSTAEERAERAREAVRQALAQGEPRAALAALKDLRKNQPDTPEALLEYAGLLVLAGEAPQATWRLEEGLARFPERHDLRVALGRVALLVSDAALARRTLEGVPADSEHHASALILRAQAELSLGNLAEALAMFEDAEKRYPDRPEARMAHIGTLLSEHRVDQAREALAQAKRAVNSEEGRAALRRAEVALYGVQAKDGDSEGAIQGLQALLDEDASDIAAWQALTSILARAGRAEEGVELLRAAIEAGPEPIVLHALYPLVAWLLNALGRPEEAEAALRELTDRSASPSAYVTLAQLYRAWNQGERAVATIEEALAAFPDDARLHGIHAEALIDIGHLAEARKAVGRHRRAGPGWWRADYLRARIQLAEGDAAGAAALLEKLVPKLDDAATQFALGQALEALGDRVGAERRYGLAMARQPWDPAPLVAMIRMAEYRGDWRAAAASAQHLVASHPGRLEAWAALVTSLANLGEGEAAREVAEKAGQVFPNRSEPLLLLGRALRVAGRHGEALVKLDEASERFSDTPEFVAERALTLGVMGRTPEAITAVRQALAEHPESTPLQGVLAALLFQVGDAEAGARAVDRALELNPGDPTPLRIRAEFRAATGHLEGAINDCEAYLAIHPDDPVVHFILGAALARSGRTDEAIAAYRRAAELDAQAFAPRNNLAELLAARGDIDGALKVAQEAYAMAEDNPYILDTVGWLYLRKGLVERSISLLEEAHAAAPGLPEVQLHLASAYQKAGRSENARRLLEDLRSRGDEIGPLRAQVDEVLYSLP